MLGDMTARRRARRALGPWLVAAVSVWLALDNGPALFDEWRLRSAGDTAMATVVSTSGASPQRVVRRFWDDLFWGRGRRVTYRFPTRDGNHTSVAFVTHQAAAGLQPGGATRVRYLTENVEVSRMDGEPGLLLLTFRLLVGRWRCSASYCCA